VADLLPDSAVVSTRALAEIRNLVEGIRPFDGLEAEHRSDVLSWLSRTDDVFRRTKPRTPGQHLVSYFLVVDGVGPQVLLVDHIKAGKWLPTGGHVEPGESPVDTVRREAREELGIQARFLPAIGERPVLLSVTETVGSRDERHTDVSLWFALQGNRDDPLTPAADEFREARWWSLEDVRAEDPARFDPHLGRMLDKLVESVSHDPVPRVAGGRMTLCRTG
jgi:8-oxo-dGTP pyrophosphatase MutT (NUDIX family)